MKFCFVLMKNNLEIFTFLLIIFLLLSKTSCSELLEKSQSESEEKFNKFPCRFSCSVCQNSLFYLKNKKKVDCRFSQCPDLCLMISSRFYSDSNPHIEIFNKNQIGICDTCFRMDLCHINQCNFQKQIIHNAIQNALESEKSFHMINENNMIFYEFNKKFHDYIFNVNLILSNLNHMNNIFESYIMLWNRSIKIKSIYLKIFFNLKKKKFSLLNPEETLEKNNIYKNNDFQNIIIQMSYKFKSLISKFSKQTSDNKIVFLPNNVYDTNQILESEKTLNDYINLNEDILRVTSEIFDISGKIQNGIDKNFNIVKLIKIELSKNYHYKNIIESLGLLDKNDLIIHNNLNQNNLKIERNNNPVNSDKKYKLMPNHIPNEFDQKSYNTSQINISDKKEENVSISKFKNDILNINNLNRIVPIQSINKNEDLIKKNSETHNSGLNPLLFKKLKNRNIKKNIKDKYYDNNNKIFNKTNTKKCNINEKNTKYISKLKSLLKKIGLKKDIIQEVNSKNLDEPENRLMNNEENLNANIDIKNKNGINQNSSEINHIKQNLRQDILNESENKALKEEKELKKTEKIDEKYLNNQEKNKRIIIELKDNKPSKESEINIKIENKLNEIIKKIEDLDKRYNNLNESNSNLNFNRKKNSDYIYKSISTERILNMPLLPMPKENELSNQRISELEMADLDILNDKREDIINKKNFIDLNQSENSNDLKFLEQSLLIKNNKILKSDFLSILEKILSGEHSNEVVIDKINNQKKDDEEITTYKNPIKYNKPSNSTKTEKENLFLKNNFMKRNEILNNQLYNFNSEKNSSKIKNLGKIFSKRLEDLSKMEEILHNITDNYEKYNLNFIENNYEKEILNDKENDIILEDDFYGDDNKKSKKLLNFIRKNKFHDQDLFYEIYNKEKAKKIKEDYLLDYDLNINDIIKSISAKRKKYILQEYKNSSNDVYLNKLKKNMDETSVFSLLSIENSIKKLDE